MVGPVTAAKVLCVGETLWDVLPSGEFLGGAPLNVAGHLSRLGVAAVLLSRVGADTRGRRALARMREIGLDTTEIQVDAEWPTGEARAVLDVAGAAQYEFARPAAWDRIAMSDGAIDLARSASAVVFGTLAQRSAATRDTIHELLGVAHWRILDINLRVPHADVQVALASLAHADFVKLNDEEVRIVAAWLGVAADPEALRQCLVDRFGTSSLCITCGAQGALLWHDGHWVEQVAHPTVVADTVGAGDSFLEMLLTELLRGSPPESAMQRAARLAAYVASRSGAIPDYDSTVLEHI